LRLTFSRMPIATGVSEKWDVNQPIFNHKVKYMRNTTISLFRGVADTNPREVNLFKALTTKKFKAQIEALRAEEDEEKRKELKRKLPCFSVSGIFQGGHKRENLVTPSNFICIDIDSQDNTHIRNFTDLKKLAEAIPWVAFCGLSCGGKGFFLVIPYTDASKHELYFAFIEKLFSLFGVVIDKACKDISRLRFVSYDDKPYINEDAKPFDYVLPSEPPIKRERRSAYSTNFKGDFNLEDWLNRNGIFYTTKAHSLAKDGTGYLVDCPWAGSHTTDKASEPDKAMVFQQPDGKLCFHCFHNHCESHDWREYRSIVEARSDFRHI